MIKLIALDVDGVIVDSAHEVFVVCQKALEERGEILDDSYEEKFMRGRNFLRTAKDFYGIIKLKDKDFDSMSQEYFNDYVNDHEEESRKMSEDFFAMRKKMQDEDYDKWFSLNRVYPGIADAIKNLSKKFSIVISSTKDFYSIYTFLERVRIDISRENIISKEISENKVDQVKIISERFAANFNEIFFIDDNPEQVKAVKKLGVNVALAGWGYTNERQKQEVREEGITILEKPGEIEKEIKRVNEE